MNRHVFTAADRAKGHASQRDGYRRRTKAERDLLNRVLAEAAMPEWYPHQ